MNNCAHSKPVMLQASASAGRDWKFKKVEDGWMWEHTTAHGGIIAAGLFVDLAQCLRDARSFGFVEARWERRAVSRTGERAEPHWPLEHRGGN
jgi:hypothetical protein